MDAFAPSTFEQSEAPDSSTGHGLRSEIVKGDLDCDGRLITYAIKGGFKDCESTLHRLIGGFH